MRDLLVGDRDDLVERLGQDRARQLAGVLHRDPVRDRVPADGAAGERRARRRLDAHEPQLRPQLPQRDRNARGETAAADREHDHLGGGRKLLGQLEPERALAGDHLRIFERVDERRARGGERPALLLGLVVARAGHDHLRAVAARRVHLRHRRVLGHEDGRRDPGLARRPRDRLPVVSRAGRDDSPAPLLVGERRDLRHRAADLERARALEVLGLEEHRTARERADRLGRVHGRDPREAGDQPACSLDVSERRAHRRPRGRP